MKEENDATPKKQDDMSYLTIVLRYYDKNKKTSHAVTDIIGQIIGAIQQQNKTNYCDVKFDLYGVCVETETEIAQGKNEFIKQINS
jgi:hypothetical protein